MGDTVTIVFDALTTGFEKGIKGVGNAIKSFSTGVDRAMGNIKKASNGVLRTMMKWGPALLGVTGVYRMISRATQQFMSENQAVQAQMTAIWSGLGNLIGPIISQLVNWLATAVAYLLQFLQILGVASAGAKKAGAAAGGAAQELKRTVAGFDELNLLQDQGGGGGGGGANGKLPEVQLSEFMEKLAEALKNKMWDDAKNLIVKRMNELIDVVKSKAREWGNVIGEYVGGALHILAGIVREVNWKGLGESVALFFQGLFDNIDPKELGTVLIGKFFIIFEMLKGFLSTEGIGTTLADVLIGIAEGALETLTQFFGDEESFYKIGQEVRHFFERFWEKKEEFIKILGDFLKAVWDGAWAFLIGFMEGDEGGADDFPITQKFKDLKKAIEDLGTAAEPVFKGIQELISQFGELVTPLLSELLDFVTGIIDAITTAINTVEAMKNGASAADLALGNYEGGKANSTLVLELESIGMTVEDLTGKEEALSGALDNSTQSVEFNKEAFDSLLSSQTDVKDKVDESAASMGEAASEAEGLAQSTDTVTQSVEGMAATAAEIQAVSDAATTAGENVAATSEQLSESAQQWAELKDNITETLEGINEAVTTNFDEAKETVDTSIEEIQQSITDAMESINTDIEGQFDTIDQTFEGRLSNLASQMNSWGAEMMDSLIAGIESRLSALDSIASTVAATVAAYIHFSEPDKGPLANFHTFAPDMMNMFADGIKQNIGVVGGAVEGVAKNVSDTISGIDPASLMEKVNAMGSVAYTAPAVAAGTVMPYGVSSMGMGGEIGGDNEAFMQTLGQQIYSAVSSAMSERGGVGGDVRTAIFNINDREFMRAVFSAQNAVANEHGVSLIIK